MHFTFWKNNTDGIHAEITWQDFIAIVAAPTAAERKDGGGGWSPIQCKGDYRAGANVEVVSAIVLDDDSSGLPLERVCELWSDVAGVVHTTHSSTPAAPRYRIVLQCSRDMTPAEHARVWAHVRDRALAHEQTLDEATRDPSRLWYVPAHPHEGPPYDWRELKGSPLDVDAIIAATPVEAPKPAAPAPTVAERSELPPAARRRAAALALGAVWPAEGQRHLAKRALAGALVGHLGWPREEALAFMRTVYSIVESRDGGNIEHAVLDDTCERVTHGEPVEGFTTLKKYLDPITVEQVQGALHRDAEWIERVNRRLEEARAANAPANDTTPAVPAFPVDALPSILGRFAVALATFTQVRVDVPAMLALGACAAAVAGRRDIEIVPGWVEGLNLFIVVALLTGERKTPVHAACFAPLVEIEHMQREAQRAFVDVAQSKRAALEKKLARLHTEYANTKREDMPLELANNSAKPGGVGIMQEIESLARELAAMKVPSLPRLLADDVTEERLAMLMAEQGGRMCVTSDEDTILQNIAGRYANGRSSFNVFLKGYSGNEPITHDRKKDSEYFSVPRPRLCVCITVQPSVIEGLAKDRSMKDKGLLARFLYSIPESMVGGRSTDVPSVPPEIFDAYRRIVQGLASMPAPADNEPIPCIKLSTEARELHKRLREWIEPRIHPKTGDLTEITDWANKFAGNVARIAGVLHCVEYGPQSHAVELSEQTMTNAIRIGEYLLAHAQAAFGVMGTTDVEADARLLETWARRKKPGVRFKMRDIARGGPGPLRGEAKRLGLALGHLVTCGTVVPEGDDAWRLAGA